MSASNIWVANQDGTGLERVTPPATVGSEWWGGRAEQAAYAYIKNTCPTLSPDGQKLAFYSSILGTVVTTRDAGGWTPPKILVGMGANIHTPQTTLEPADLP